ncbi:hypothetical protein, partial [Streptomyces sp. NPDC055085]
AVVGQGTPDGRRLRDDAEGVLSSLPFTLLTGDEAQTATGYRPVAWLTIRTPYRCTPTANSSCACGRNRDASGHADVWALIADHEAHRNLCSLRTSQEGRNAA